MSRVLIAVGGTGQEIALSCLRLSLMAGLDLPLVLIIDSDQGTSKSPAVRTRMDELQRLAGHVKDSQRRDLVVFLKPLAENIRDRQLEDLESLFKPAGLMRPTVRDALTLHLTDDQRLTKIIDGFHAEPTVGSIAVDDYMRQGPFRADLLDTLDKLTGPEGHHFVVVAGSTTGGTGPGVIPPLTRRLIEWRNLLRPPRAIEFSGVVQLQWFHPLRDTEVEWSQPPDIDLGRLQRNSACLVRQYDQELVRFLDRLVLLSLPRVVSRVSAGPNRQPETLHWLNILCGWVAAELLGDGPTLQEVQSGGLYSYSLADNFSPRAPLFHRDDRRTPEQRSPLPLGRALDATRVLAALGKGVVRQLGQGRLDPALPRYSYRFVRRLRDTDGGGEAPVRDFAKKFAELTAVDEAMVNWFSESCASRARPGDRSSDRHPDDVREVFRLPAGESATDTANVGRLLKHPRLMEQDLVAFLVERANPDVSAGPIPAAVEFYRSARTKLLDELLKNR